MNVLEKVYRHTSTGSGQVLRLAQDKLTQCDKKIKIHCQAELVEA